GILGDRLGRRRAIICATAVFGLFTLAFAGAASYGQMVILRLLNGVALGGAVPLVWALSVEYVPRHDRDRDHDGLRHRRRGRRAHRGQAVDPLVWLAGGVHIWRCGLTARGGPAVLAAA